MSDEIIYRVAGKEDLDILMNIRFEMIRVVNNLSPDYKFAEGITEYTRRYFLDGNQTTMIAQVDGKTIACASLSYIEIMPTFSHPTGKRAHLMNVYTNMDYRRQGISEKLLQMLIDEAREKGVTEISLDTTSAGRPLYSKLGFVGSKENMVLKM